MVKRQFFNPPLTDEQIEYLQTFQDILYDREEKS